MYRVQKLLSNWGFCSRRKAEELIKEGKVKVNGKIISLGAKATNKDVILVNGKRINKEKKVYLMLNKPEGCVTALRDKYDKTVMDYVNVKERVFPVGRLDKDTSGLLILTNDGDFANKMMHPKFETKKTYLVELNKQIKSKDIQSLEKGVLLKDGKTSPAKIKKLSFKLLEITIHEGKNRIVRRMFEKLGYDVLSLKRTKIGKLSLGKLKIGDSKILTEKELGKLTINL